MNWIIFHALLFSYYIQRLSAELNVPELLANERNIGSAGTRARISRKGINYVANVLTRNLIPEIVGAQMNEEPNQMEIGSEIVYLNELSMEATEYRTPVLTELSPPHLILLSIPELNLTSKLQISGNISGIPLDAMVSIQSESTTVQLGIQPMRTSTGAPNLRIQDCKIELVKPTQLLFNKNQITEEQLTLIRPALEKEAANLLNDLICNRVHFIVEDRVNDRFGLLSQKIALKHIGDDEIIKDLTTRIRSRRQRQANHQREGGMEEEFDVTAEDMQFGEIPRFLRAKRQWNGNMGAGLRLPMGMNIGAGLGRKKREISIAGFNVSRANNLALDYTITSDMNITKFGLEIESSGEVSLRGRGGTPFGPVKVPLPESVNEQYMLQMIVSDYMPNSLMYHGHTVGLFKTRVDPTTSHLGAIMRTTCSLSTGVLFCLGDLFPTLKRLHPNRRLALNFNTVQAPVIRFRTQASGGISFNLLGQIAFLVIDPETRQETQIAEISIEVLAQMKLRLSSAMVRPKITLEKIKLATLSPGILLQNELDDASMLSREVLQRMVNNILQDGIPIPVHPLFKLVKPKVKVMDRALLLQTNFDLNDNLVRQITTGDFRKRL